MPKEIVIGILAGMRPRSTAPFINKVIDYSQKLYGARYDPDFPSMLIHSVPVPYYSNKPVNHELMLSSLKRGIEKLVKADVDFLVIPSNYLHHYYEELKTEISKPILHMIKETLSNLPKSNKKSALLAANSTIETQSYQKEFENFGIAFFHDDELQDNVSQLIISLKQTGLSAHSQKLWKKVYNYCLDNKCDSIVNTSRDLTPCLEIEGSDQFVNITDSYDILAKVCVKKYIELNQYNSTQIFKKGA